MSSTNPFSHLLRSHTIVKIVVTAFLTLLLLIPLSSIENLVEERSQRRLEVLSLLTQQWGPPVTLRGPLLVVPGEYEDEYHYLIPSTLEVNGTIPVVERYRSIFKLPTYQSDLKFEGAFSLPESTLPPTPIPLPPTLDTDPAISPDPAISAEPAFLVFLIESDTAPVVQGRAEVAGAEIPLRFSRERLGIRGAILIGEVPDVKGKASAGFRANIEAFGSDSFHIAPVGKDVRLAMDSDWPHPSFDGARLPSSRTVTADGFEATWDFNAALLGGISSHEGASLSTHIAASPRVSVRLVEPVGHYHQVTRGVKYAMLVITLTFVALFLFEIIAKVSIHPIQYLLVGCALVLFYLLLLSVSEHLNFIWAYVIAATAVVGLISGYARAVLAKAGRAAVLGLALGGVYGLLYVILQEETLALLAGAWALFALLAALMFLTRKIDWTRFGKSKPEHTCTAPNADDGSSLRVPST